ncbi:MAG: aminoacyl-histidine dipeptidase [Bacillota bacterium]|nr:aminoacyl-histidine dipeptidase [Bacillota bacterium]
MKKLENIQYEKVFKNFEKINKIPRCSKEEEKISNFLKGWAQERNLEVIQDEALNIIIKKPSTDENKSNSTLILQGHMDMVCEKNSDKEHDFSQDPIKLVIKDDYIYGDDTTLGADNGIAIAMFMSILESNDIKHSNLEVLITTDEESGMTGVLKLDPSNLNGKTLINLDSEVEGELTAGCAGGGRLSLKIRKDFKESTFNNTCKIFISGLSGGHSGIDIDKEKANSNKILGRLLYIIEEYIDIKELYGGSKSNAIPREAAVVVKTDNLEVIADKLSVLIEEIKKEYQISDPNIDIRIEKVRSDDRKVFSDETKKKLIRGINLIKNGPMKKSTEIDLIIFSNNLGVIKEDDKYIELICAPRSSMESVLKNFRGEMEQLSQVLDVEYIEGDFYPGWEYASESYIRDLCKKTYKETFNNEAEVSAIHAGLECGFLSEKIDNLDAISLGPNMFDVHTPNEHLSIESTQRTYKFLCNILENYNK